MKGGGKFLFIVEVYLHSHDAFLKTKKVVKKPYAM